MIKLKEQRDEELSLTALQHSVSLQISEHKGNVK